MQERVNSVDPRYSNPAHSEGKSVFRTSLWLIPGIWALWPWNMLPDECFGMPEALGHAVTVWQLVYADNVTYSECLFCWGEKDSEWLPNKSTGHQGSGELLWLSYILDERIKYLPQEWDTWKLAPGYSWKSHHLHLSFADFNLYLFTVINHKCVNKASKTSESF